MEFGSFSRPDNWLNLYSKTTPPLSASEVTNLWGLAALADETDEADRVMKAEILRELGQFDEALALLKEQPISPTHTRVAAVIPYHAEQGDVFVHPIPDDSPDRHEETECLAEGDQGESARSCAWRSPGSNWIAPAKPLLSK